MHNARRIGFIAVCALGLAWRASAQAVLAELQGSSSATSFGASVGPLGDVNADGFDDFVTMFVDPGTPGSLPIPTTIIVSGRSGHLITTFAQNWLMGSVGDVNADGRGDFLAGRSSPQGYTVVSGGVPYYPVFDLSLPMSCASVGPSDAAGDLNTDGFGDVIVGGVCGIYARAYSGPNGVELPYIDFGVLASSMDVAGVGDMNLDGHDDVAVASHYFVQNVSSPAHVTVRSGANGAVLFTWTGPDDFFGAIAGVGDTNGDGRPDLAMRAGNQLLVRSGADGSVLLLLDTPWGSAGIASAIARAGDLNGDGRSDLLVYWTGVGSTPLVSAISGADGSIVFDAAVTGGNGSVSISDAGDFNADGFDDALIGIPGHVVGSTPDLGVVRVVSGAPCPPDSYCTAKLNSAGCTPIAWATGSASRSGPDDLFVNAKQVLTNKTGILFWGRNPSGVPFAGGTLCVGAPQVRTSQQNSGGASSGLDCTGTFSYHFSHAYMAQYGLGVGTTVYCQYWYRDPGYVPPSNIGLTDATFFTVCF